MGVIYTITSKVDSKVYVGYASDFDRRKSCHLSTLRNGRHRNILLQRAFNKHGEENFLFEVIEEWGDEFLPSMENYWVIMLGSSDRKHGYNIQCTGDKASPMKGKTHSFESRVKIGQTRRENYNGKASPNFDYKSLGQKLSKIGKDKAENNLYTIRSIKGNKVIDTLTGQEFNSVSSAARSIDMSADTLRRMLTGISKNTTTLELNKEID